jgi:hypothetical protein
MGPNRENMVEKSFTLFAALICSFKGRKVLKSESLI